MSKKIRFPANIERVIIHCITGSQRVELNLENGVGEIFDDATVDQLVEDGIKEYTGPTEEEARLMAEGKRPLAPGQAAPASVPNSPGTDLSNTKSGNQPKPITPEALAQASARRESERRRLGSDEKVPAGPVTMEELQKEEADRKKARDDAAKQYEEAVKKEAAARKPADGKYDFQPQKTTPAPTTGGAK